MEERFLFKSASRVAVALCVSVLPGLVSAATFERAPEVKVFSEQYSEQGSAGWQARQAFFAYHQKFMGGGTVAVGDLGTDGVNEIVTGAGVGGSPHIRVFRSDGSFMSQFYAYDQTLKSGVNVAMGDADGDGRDEIVTAPQYGGGPQVRVFNGQGKSKGTTGFYAYDEAFTGGVNIAVGDVNGDGTAEIVTGNGEGGSSQVRVFSGSGQWKGLDFFPFPEDSRGGVSVAVGNVDGGAESEIIMAVQSNGEAWIKVYKYNIARTIVGEFKAIADDFRGGVNVAAGDVDGDGMDEIIVAVHGKGGPQVKMYEAYGKDINAGFFAYEGEFQSGVSLAVAQMTSDKRADIITMPSKIRPEGRTDVERYVRVDLSEQRLYAYEKGYLVNSFLISSGLARTPTPLGETQIQRKIYSHLYSGPGYYLPNTLYNLQFRPHYYLHGAYWHNNFGHPMSHGCVNIHYRDAEWLFGWMQVGDLTVIEQ